jgi:Tfp pilus assembly protein PilZ
MQDRRSKPRIECSYPAIVRGTDARGKKYQREAIARNLSVGGLYLQLNQPAEVGSQLLVVVNLSSEPATPAEALSVAARGVVVRTEVRPDGTHGMGIRFERYRFV